MDYGRLKLMHPTNEIKNLSQENCPLARSFFCFPITSAALADIGRLTQGG
jgi:hypothetical protein